MLTLKATTTKGQTTIQTPERMAEMSVEQLQNVVAKWDWEDWVQCFSLVTGIPADYIEQSTDGSTENALYQTIEFLLDKREWEKLNQLPIPKTLTIQPIWFKDCPLIPKEIDLPKKLGRMSIGQTIQARKHLEGVRDLREGISMVTAIYLQPLLDAEKDKRGKLIPAKFDMLQVIHYESLIAKMYVTHIYPIGFFLLKRLNESGTRRMSVWRVIRNWFQKQTKL
jgi:hypothetical protein